jgi:hypothetical protein
MVMFVCPEPFEPWYMIRASQVPPISRFALARKLPGISVVVKVAPLFISGIEPIAGMWKLKDAASIWTGVPDWSVKESKRSFSPFLSSPELFAMVTVRLFTVADLMAFSRPVDPELPQAAENAVAIAITQMIKSALTLIDSSPHEMPVRFEKTRGHRRRSLAQGSS